MLNYVPFEEVVSEAISVVGSGQDTELLKSLSRQWIWRFLQEQPVTEDQIRVCKIYPKNLILPKPDDLRKHLEIAFYDDSDNFIPAVYHSGKKRIYPDLRVFPTATATTNTQPCPVPVDYSQDQFAFYLGSNGTDVAYAQVRYYSYPLDSDGMPLISQDEILGCIYFVRFMASLRKNDNRSEIQQNELLYKAESDKLRAKKKLASLSNDERKLIASIRNRMLPNFNRSRF
jgi:hypothetical protein